MRSVRAAAILIFAFFLATPAGAKKAPATISETVSEYIDVEEEDVFAAKSEAIQKIIAKDMRELPPVFERFEALQKKYEGTENLADLAPERKELRDELTAGWRRLNDEAREFHKIRKDYQFQQGIILFSKIVQGKSDSNIKENFDTIYDLGNYHKGEVLSFKNKIRNGLLAETKLFNRIAAQRKHARKLRLYAKSGAVLLIVLMGAVFYWARTKKKYPLPVSAQLPPGASTPSPVAKPPPEANAIVGQTVGERFKVEKLIRMGTLGPVYEATDTRDASKVILKAVVEDFHRTTGDLDRFFEKTKVLAAFKHTSLAEVREVFREDSRIYIASQRVSGMPLAKYISPGNLIELRSIKLIASQIAILIDAAHAGKLIHGDLGPSNIIVQENGAVKVLDFGIGIEARKMSTKLSLGRKVGDPAYLAPEQELGSDFPQSDIYSLGILCFAMLTGRIPFEGPNYLAQKRERRYTPASSLSEKIPVEIDPVLHKALEPEPAHRYHKGMDFFDALDAVPEKVS